MRMMGSNNKKSFFKDYPEWKKYKKDYNKVLHLFRDIFYEELFKGKEITTPIGSFQIFKYKPKAEFKKKPIDWKSTKEEGFVVRHLNEHTNYYGIDVTWKSLSKYSRYKQKTVRHLNRALAKYIFNNPEAYKNYDELNKY
jgi:hypothetical protein